MEQHARHTPASLQDMRPSLLQTHARLGKLPQRPPACKTSRHCRRNSGPMLPSALSAGSDAAVWAAFGCRPADVCPGPEGGLGGAGLSKNPDLNPEIKS